jgi:hypothetical protein
MIAPIYLQPTDADFVSILNRRLELIGAALEARSETAAVVSGSGSGYAGSHEQRVRTYPAASVSLGTIFYETDRNAVYLCVPAGVNGHVWKWVAGGMAGTLSPSQLPTDLTADDIGFRFYSTDFHHRYKWIGVGAATYGGFTTPTGWVLAYEDGEIGNNFIAWFLGAPPTAGWHICDGSAANVANRYAVVASLAMPNLIGNYVKGAAAYTGSVVAAVVPTLGASNSNVTINSPASGTAVTVATGVHFHTATAGEPAHVDLIPYYRL